MSCEECGKALVIDGADPACFDGECVIPSLDEDGTRIMEIRQKLITLRELVGPETIMRMYEATKEDLDLLEVVAEELSKAAPEPVKPNPEVPNGRS